MGVDNANNKNIYNSEEKKLEVLQRTSHFLFFKRLKEKDIKLLYKHENKNVKLFFEYNLIMENQTINVKIDEDFIFEGVKSYVNIFHIG
jgi:hypothetical protein